MSNFRSVNVVAQLIQKGIIKLKGIIQKKLYITEHHKNDEDDFEDFLSMGTIFQESEKEGQNIPGGYRTKNDAKREGKDLKLRARSDNNRIKKSEKSEDSNEDESFHLHYYSNEDEIEEAHKERLEMLSNFEGNEVLNLVDVIIRLKSADKSEQLLLTVRKSRGLFKFPISQFLC